MENHGFIWILYGFYGISKVHFTDFTMKNREDR
jgi:hypothetical protein